MTPKRATTRRRGAVVPLIAISLLALIGFTALSLDGGMMMYQRQRARTTADAAALAAAESLYLHAMQNGGLDPDGLARSAALAITAAAGYSNDGTNSVVTVNIPPASGTFAGKAGYAEVAIQHNQTRSFSIIWGTDRLPVTARGVARGLWTAFNNGIIVLDPSMPSALSLSGGGKATVLNASVIVDSNDVQAAYSGGGSLATADEFDIVGGYASSSGGGFVGVMNPGSPPVPDPLAYLPPPDPSTLSIQSTKKLSISNGTVTLEPGVYKGGIQISGQANVTLKPGIYYMDTGGFAFGGGGSSGGSLTGTGVMIYNAPAPKSNSDVISITGNPSSTISLSPPTTGLYQGIALWQDRTSTQTLSVSGNGNFNVSGTFYAAKALMSVSGNGNSATIGSQYISNSLAISGSGAFNVSWNQFNTARTRIIGIVE